MAGLDLYAVFCTAQALGNTGANSSGSTIDLGAGKDAFGATLANPDVGMGKPVFVNIIMTEAAAATGGSATSTFEVHDSADDGNGAPASFAKILSTTTIDKATLVAGWKWSFALPPGTRRHLKVVNTVASNNMTSGKYTAWLSGEPVATV